MSLKKLFSKSKSVDILANLPDCVILVDHTGKIEWVNNNAPYMFNLSKNDLLNLSIDEIVENGLSIAEGSINTAKPIIAKAKHNYDNDTFLEVIAKRAEDGFVITLRNVTQDYKKMTSIIVEHESSKKVNKDKNAFLVKLSNEIKSPLHSIVGFSQAMIDGLGGRMSDKQEKYVKIINKNSNELLYFMDKVLELSKTEANMFEHDMQTFDLINATQAVIKNNEQIIHDKNLALNFDTTDVVKRAVYSDENAYKAIMQNLLETAIKSTDIGSINIKAFHPDLDIVAHNGVEVPQGATDKSYMLITISDTGAGIYENDLEVLFDPYAQLDKTNKKHIIRAIALASVKNLLKHLNGSVWVESEPMQGTTYNILMQIEKILPQSETPQPIEIEEEQELPLEEILETDEQEDE